MMTQAGPRPPVIPGDDWEPPPRPARISRGLVGAVLAAGCIVFVVIRAFGSRVEAPAPTESPWSPIRSSPSADSGPPAHALQPAPLPTPRRSAVAQRPAPIRPGYLSINSTPWAELSVDGTVVGNTPQPKIRVAPGRHQLVFARDGFETQRTWVTVEPGATVRLTSIALKRAVAAR